MARQTEQSYRVTKFICKLEEEGKFVILGGTFKNGLIKIKRKFGRR